MAQHAGIADLVPYVCKLVLYNDRDHGRLALMDIAYSKASIRHGPPSLVTRVSP